jgi:DNA primase
VRLNDHISLSLDVQAWMTQTGRFSNIRASDGREWIQSTCVFHDDRHPSFAVNSDTGVFKCQACGASGNFVKLVQHVEGHDTAYDAEQSLIARFARYVPATDEALQLDFGDREEETFVDAPNVDFASTHNTPYFARRGLTLETTRRFGAVEATFTPAIALPWFDAKGRCVTIKHRSIVDKAFWYDPPVSPGCLKRLLYGFHPARQAKIIVVCEGEIDAMSVAQAGFSAVALGGAHLSTSQATLLKNSVCDEVVVFTDNDEAGRKARAAIVDALVGHKRVSVVDWSSPSEHFVDPDTKEVVAERTPTLKDANDVLRWGGEKAIQVMLEQRIPVGLSLKLDK